MLKMKKRILLVITIIITSVIFLHSSMSAAESTVESDAAYGILDGMTSFFGLPNFLTGITIRKAAHFMEFAVFGFFLSSTVHSYAAGFKNQIFKILFFLLAVPVTDEFIQYFSEGRSAQVSDVLIDFSGGLCGFFALGVFLSIVTWINNRKRADGKSN